MDWHRTTGSLLLTVSLLLPGACEASGPALDVSGEVRARSEIDGRGFDPGLATRHYTDLRSRLLITARGGDNVTAVIQLQDSRRLGGLTDEGEPASGLLNDGSNVDVHQAYLRVDRLWRGGPGLQAGRFEVNLGNQRVFGAVGWHNVGRSWEGLSAFLERAELTATGYWLKRLERDAGDENRDFDVYGLNVAVPSSGLEVFTFVEHDAEAVLPGSGNETNRLDRRDYGLYYHRKSGRLDVTANAVLQEGERGLPDGDTVREENIAAYLVTAELGYTFPGAAGVRIAAGIDYASGDDDPADDEHRAYDNLYYTGHKFRGYMDYFLASDDRGLMDLMARTSFVPVDGWRIAADLHLFRTAAEYVDLEGAGTRDVGFEADLTASTTRVAGLGLTAGAALFVPTESFAGTPDPDTGLWLYGMLTAAFGGK